MAWNRRVVATFGALALGAVTMAACIPGEVVTPGSPGTTSVRMVVDTTKARRAISAQIYGINPHIEYGGALDDVRRLDPTMLRLGGNRWGTWNWENNASNAGSDFQHQNDAYLAFSDSVGAAVQPSITQARQEGAGLMVTVPIGDHVAADKAPQGDVRLSGPDYLTTRFRRNVAAGAPAATPNKGDATVYQDGFVTWARTAMAGMPVVFSLDNEPELWTQTHARVRTAKITYRELAFRSVAYASMIKRIWPSAKVSGAANFGWPGYANLLNAPDAGGKGFFIDWYLQQMAAVQRSSGKRLLDYLDLHWYPEHRAPQTGVRVTDPSNEPWLATARLQAPRSLWDPTFTENSFIPRSYGTGPIRLIPRMKEKIARNYPGTKLAITEWNYGGGGFVTGALATADVLGIFGREGVDLATFWPLNDDETWSYAGFQSFRNFDGAGADFGNTSVLAQTSDSTLSSVYASIDLNNPNRVVLVVINKSTDDRSTGIRLTANSAFRSAKVWTVTKTGGPAPVAQADITPVATNAFRYVMPKRSISIIVPQP